METKANNVLENTRSADWERELVTHYTCIGTEVRENYRDGYPNCSKGGGLGRRRPVDATLPQRPYLRSRKGLTANGNLRQALFFLPPLVKTSRLRLTVCGLNRCEVGLRPLRYEGATSSL